MEKYDLAVDLVNAFSFRLDKRGRWATMASTGAMRRISVSQGFVLHRQQRGLRQDMAGGRLESPVQRRHVRGVPGPLLRRNGTRRACRRVDSFDVILGESEQTAPPGEGGRAVVEFLEGGVPVGGIRARA